MIIYRKYGKTIEITETSKEPSSNRRLFCRQKLDYLNVRRSDSVRRTKRICLRRLSVAIESLGSPLLITLTFDGVANDVLYSSQCFTAFGRRLRDEFPDSHFLFVPELSPRGRLHFHGLLFGLSQDWGDKYTRKSKYSKRVCVFVGRERHERLFQKLWQVGFVDIEQTDGSDRLAGYLSKYITDAVNNPLFTPIRLIRLSKGFPTHFEVRGKIAQELKSYIKKSPRFVGSFYTSFLGHITKSFY